MTPVMILDHAHYNSSEVGPPPESWDHACHLNENDISRNLPNSPTSLVKPQNPHGNVRTLSTESGGTFATTLSHSSRMDWTVMSNNEMTDGLGSVGEEGMTGLHASWTSKMHLVVEETNSTNEAEHHVTLMDHTHNSTVDHRSELGVPTSVHIHRSRIPIVAFNRLRIDDTKRNHRQVSFHEVQIRKYPMIAGDNPSCQVGVPVTLDWGFEELPALDLDDFESMRSLTRRRKLHHLLLNYYQRQRILMGIGYTEVEIKKAEKETDRFRLQRDMTRLLLPLSKFEEIMQSLCRKVMRRVSKTERQSKLEFHQTILKLRSDDAQRTVRPE